MQPLFDVHKPRGGSKRVPIGVPIGSRTTTAAAHPIVTEDAAFGAHRVAYFGTPAVPLFVPAADPGRQLPRKTECFRRLLLRWQRQPFGSAGGLSKLTFDFEFWLN